MTKYEMMRKSGHHLKATPANEGRPVRFDKTLRSNEETLRSSVSGFGKLNL